jgi:DNA-binding transcriptional regulator YiaG
MVLPSYQATLEHDGCKYELLVENLPAHRCSNCQTLVLGDEADNLLSNALRRSAGLLSPAEIRAKRDALGLTQAQMANYLRISASTLSRWESGAQIQQRSMDVLLRGFFSIPEFRASLNVPDSSLPHYQSYAQHGV